MARTRGTLKNSLRGNNYGKNLARSVNYVHDTPTHPDLHPNQMLSKNLKGHRSSGAHKNVPKDACQVIAISPKTFGQVVKNVQVLPICLIQCLHF